MCTLRESVSSLQLFSNIKRHTILVWKVILEIETSQDKAKIVAHPGKTWIPNDHRYWKGSCAGAEEQQRKVFWQICNEFKRTELFTFTINFRKRMIK